MTAVDAAGRVAALRHVRAIVLLPLMNTAVVPAALLALDSDADPGWTLRGGAPGMTALAAGVLLLAVGLWLAIRSVTLFVRHGRGTLAPWDPARFLMTGDLYSIMRNPMKIGLFSILIAQSMLLSSPALAVWAGTFVIVNLAYVPLFEERGLEQRFGTAYSDYAERVPRWLPSAARLRDGLRRREVGRHRVIRS